MESSLFPLCGEAPFCCPMEGYWLLFAQETTFDASMAGLCMNIRPVDSRQTNIREASSLSCCEQVIRTDAEASAKSGPPMMIDNVRLAGRSSDLTSIQLQPQSSAPISYLPDNRSIALVDVLPMSNRVGTVHAPEHFEPPSSHMASPGLPIGQPAQE